jgi:predicted MFS family arabinose efflux permease
VGGIVADVLSWRELFGLYGVCALALTVALFRIPSGRPAGHAATPGGRAATWLRSFGLLRLARARRLYLLVGLEGLVTYGGFTYLGALLQDRYGLDYFRIGLVLACYGLGTLLTSRVLRRLLGRLGERGLILWGGLLLGGSYLLLEPLPTWQPYIPVLLLMGAGFSMFHSTLQVRATQLVPEMRGAAVSLFAFSLFSGAGIGTALLGLLASDGAYSALLLIAGCGQVAVTLGAWLEREPA